MTPFISTYKVSCSLICDNIKYMVYLFENAYIIYGSNGCTQKKYYEGYHKQHKTTAHLGNLKRTKL